uniref:Uncharacterized protein n=1 Tax=Avena sativa TaxID=4498 RepID=A0ACD5WVA8_AVESA
MPKDKDTERGGCNHNQQLIGTTMELASLPLLGFLASLLFLLGVTKKIYTCSAPGDRQPPGPWNLPLLGSLHHVLLSRYRDQPHRALRELSGRHGPLMLLRLGVVPALVVSSAEGAREVLKTQDTAFASRHLSPTMEIFTRGGQDIFFAPYDDLWRQLRRICVLELFSTRRVMSFSRIREEEVATLLRSVADQAGADADVEIGALTSRIITDMVTRSTIGGRCLRRDEFLHEVSKSVKLSAGFNLADLYPSSKLARWLSGGLRDAERCYRNMRAIMDDIIQERAQATADADVESEEDLLGVLLRLHREGGPLTIDIITTVIVEVLGAGGEASWATLEWAMSELMRNPRVLHKAQAEVRGMFQGRRQCRLADGDVLGRLSYLQLVIKETLRLHPPVPFLLPRQCREPCQLMGYPVPEGTKVLVNAWALGRDAAYWERAEEFEPERFEAAAMDYKGATNFEYIPFGGGKRMCPGVALSMANMELLLASLLYHFDWELPVGVRPEEIDMTEAFGITLQRKTKLVMRATLRIPFDTLVS